ncbi:hypothetical protein TERTU_2552 [Teredinibacter turnerae T7901]|uniref:Uncharacterized protein n=1 Tax=Teredinibacter turnerae (strain ATCC 39867 / T7901) TaxID=377629 RepID=C5BLP3_TERTT|nr:hypothetical protein TERTU_2552 [Teredinibacter turnerae T7901]
MQILTLLSKRLLTLKHAQTGQNWLQQAVSTTNFDNKLQILV